MTVITPALPDREQLLDACKRSVAAQTHHCVHEVFVDKFRAGPQSVRNMLARKAKTEWLLPVDDDDVLDSDCVEVLLRHSRDADIVYPFCRMDGRTDGWVPNRLFNPKTLFRRPFIPVTALIRKDLFDLLAGYQFLPMEDWNFYQRAYLHGARFKCVPEVLWTYRFHDSNTYQYEREAA